MDYKSRIKFFPFYILSSIPMFLMYFIADFGFIVVYYLVRYRRDVVRDNLTNSFPTKSKEEIIIIEKIFYRHFCDLMVESLKPLTMSREDLISRVRFKNPEIVQKLYDKNRSIIMYSAHYGNWEWLAILSAYIPHQLVSFYHPQSNSYFDALMKIIRERFGAICIESNKGYKSMVSYQQKNILTLNCIIGDQSPQIDSTKHWIQFLNQDTAFLIGADRIAKKSNQVVVFPVMRKIKRGYYEFEFIILEDNPALVADYSMIDKYARILEETITAAPELWLWSHRRWKLKRNETDQKIPVNVLAAV